MGKKIRILWVDDEIDLLKPYILFLEEKGYQLSTANNGEDAIQKVIDEEIDLIFLDENMPGLSGLETLSRIKLLNNSVPVVMITKSEEEDIMELAIGSKIADYLIKPVNPNQILLSIKKNTDNKRLINEKTNHDYQTQFGQLSFLINSARDYKDWIEIYKKLVYWDLEFQETEDSAMDEILNHQKTEANRAFSKYIKRNYTDWFDNASNDRPLLSPSVFQHSVFPLLKNDEKVVFILIDNLRYDQWKIFEKELVSFTRVEKEDLYYSILPTTTQYARNAMFAGLMPEEISKHSPDLWVIDEEEGGKNLKEKELFEKQLKRSGLNKSFNYQKITNQKAGKKLPEMSAEMMNYDLNIIIYNFVDMLSHARTDTEMVKELTGSDAAYLSLTASWFRHSYLMELLKKFSGKDIKLIITTDHGSIRVENPVKVIGDKKTSTNLRYKLGKSLNYNKDEVFEITKPELAHLPKSNISSRYIFAVENDFLVYPNNYNYYVNYFKNTFQHGGVSMQEMIIPIVQLSL